MKKLSDKELFDLATSKETPGRLRTNALRFVLDPVRDKIVELLHDPCFAKNKLMLLAYMQQNGDIPKWIGQWQFYRYVKENITHNYRRGENKVTDENSKQSQP